MKVIFLDFDSTLFKVPDQKTGKEIYLKKHGVQYPHIGWWSKPESLCQDTFDIKPISKIGQIFKTSKSDPNTKTVLLTNRILKMEPTIMKILDKHNYVLDLYTFKDKDNKGERMKKILNMVFSGALEADFYDDDTTHLIDAKRAMIGHPVRLRLFHVQGDDIVEFIENEKEAV